MLLRCPQLTCVAGAVPAAHRVGARGLGVCAVAPRVCGVGRAFIDVFATLKCPLALMCYFFSQSNNPRTIKSQ